MKASGTTRSLMWRIRMLMSRDSGFSLVEILVATGLFVLVATLVGTEIVAATALTRKTSAGVQTQSQLLDAVSRVTRDVTAAQPVVAASQNDVTLQIQRNGTCTRTRYYLNPSDRTIINDIQSSAGLACPSSAAGWAALPTTSLTVAKGLTNGISHKDVFTYYSGKNQALTQPVSDPQQIARVGIAVDAAVKDRNKDLQLVTSAAIAKGLTPDTNTVSGTLPTPTLTGSLVNNTAKLNWPGDPAFTGYVLTRDGQVIARINNTTTLSYADSNLTPGQTYKYVLYGTGASGTSPASNTVTLAPLVGNLPVNGSGGPTTASATIPATDGLTQTPVIKDQPGTGGLAADMTQSSTPSQPITSQVATTVPVYSWVTHTVPVYGNIAYQAPDYGNIPQQQPVYGNIPQYSQQPVYRQTPIYQTQPVYGFVYKKSRTYEINLTTKCYIFGTAPLPNPSCLPYDATRLRYGNGTLHNLVFIGDNLTAYPSATQQAYFQGGSCDEYSPVKSSTTYIPDVGYYTFIQGNDPTGKWNGPNGYGYYYACMYKPTYLYEQTGTKQVIVGYNTSIVGYTSVFTGYIYGITGYITVYVYGIVGYHTSYYYGITGYNTYQSYDLTGYQTVYTTQITGYTTASVKRDYTLRWAGTGPCPTVQSLPKTVTVYDGPVPTTLTVNYDSVTQTAFLTAAGVPGTIVSVSVPLSCIY